MDPPEGRCERRRLFATIDGAFKSGNFESLGRALGGSPRWFDEHMPAELGLGHPLEYAIYWSSMAFISRLLDVGSNPNYDDHAGFPSIIATLSTDRPDKLAILAMLIRHGADPNGRGVNDWTPLHYAVSRRDTEAISLLLASGADPFLRTRIDDQTTSLEEAEAAGFDAGADLLRSSMSARRD